ncbi:uncharacterized protein LOC135843040 [Planococcus citri]|uniref:uncharacterized protein LOC135843040 n=1 Tax=Planococcus citri TaxID=170843 RepID=UPI0031F849D8
MSGPVVLSRREKTPSSVTNHSLESKYSPKSAVTADDVRCCNQCIECTRILYIQNFGVISAVIMMLIPVVYVIIAFSQSVNTKVIAGPATASVPINPFIKYLSSLITFFNACGQDPQCFISYIISSGDVKLYRSPIVYAGESSFFRYPNTSDVLHVTIFKHIDAQDPGTVIFRKKIEHKNQCFGFDVIGKYSSPKVVISNCFTSCYLNTCNGTRSSTLQVANNTTRNAFIVVMEFRYGTDMSTRDILPSQTAKQGLLSNVYAEPPTISFYKKQDVSSPKFLIEENLKLGIYDTCVKLEGNYEDPQIVFVPCTLLLRTNTGCKPSALIPEGKSKTVFSRTCTYM